MRQRASSSHATPRRVDDPRTDGRRTDGRRTDGPQATSPDAVGPLATSPGDAARAASDPARGVVLGLALFVLFVLGVLTGLLGSFLVPARVLGVQALGTVTAVVALPAMAWLGGWLTGRRAGAVLPVVGWLVPVIYFAVGRPEGDVIIPGSAAGLAFIAVGAIVGSSASVLAPPPRLPVTRPVPRPEPGGPSSGPGREGTAAGGRAGRTPVRPSPRGRGRREPPRGGDRA